MRFLASAIVSITFVLGSCGHNPDAGTNVNRGQSSTAKQIVRQPCVNLNTATTEELQRLRGIGEVIAKRIIDYRQRNGRFRRPQEIIIIKGFSEKKYRAIADLICVE